MRLNVRGVILLLTALFLAASTAFGIPTTSDDAASVVRGWLKKNHARLGENLGAELGAVTTFKDSSGTPLYHVVALQPSGFVIVAGDDLVEPIIAFSKRGQFDPAQENPLGALVHNDLPNRIAGTHQKAASIQAKAASEPQDKWQRLQQIDKAPASRTTASIDYPSDVRVHPFVESHWGQMTADNYVDGPACFNYYTPGFSPGDSRNFPSGCVATAMAQLMRYYQYPQSSVGKAAFSVTVSGYPKVFFLRGGDGQGGPYRWEDMPLDTDSDTSEIECQAIGALTYDAGVSVNMSFDSTGSAAGTLAAKKALTSTFRFRNAINGSNAGADIGGGLLGMINPNLDAGFPVFLGINAPASSHAVICDGYGYDESTLYHHLNLGWTGNDDAWYALPVIDTEYTVYTAIIKTIYNVHPTKSGEIISGRILDIWGWPIAGAAISAARAGGGAYSAVTDDNGIYALSGIPSSSRYTISVSAEGYLSSSATYSTGSSVDGNPRSGNYWGANFTLPQGTPLSLSASPSDGGTVAGNGWFLDGSQRVITASPNPGWRFTQWEDGDTANPRTVTVQPGGVTFVALFDGDGLLPYVARQPSSALNLPQGTNITLSIDAQGKAPLSFQWLRNGASIPDATNASYSFAAQPVSGSSRLDFSVLVSNELGSTISSNATVTIVLDSLRPTLAIQSPRAGGRFLGPIVGLTGAVKDNVRVASVLYQLNGGDWANAAISSSRAAWSGAVAPVVRSNIVRVCAVDMAGNRSLTSSVPFVYVMPSALTLSTNGSGFISRAFRGLDLEVGNGYTLTAVPSSGNWMFSRWTGDVNSFNPALHFVMGFGTSLAATFVTNAYPARKGTYQGLFYESDQPQAQSSGLFTFTLTERGAFSGKIVQGVAAYSFTGTFDGSGHAIVPITRARKTPLTLEWQVDLDNQTDTITGQISDGTWIATARGDRAIYNARKNVCPWKGAYTLAIPGGPNPGPAGAGYFCMTVDAGGAVTGSGELADGTALRLASTISQAGQWPLYQSLWGGNGMILGWISATNVAASEFVNQIVWSKPVVPATKGSIYSSGFTNNVRLLWSPYVPPAKLTRCLNLTEGWLTWTDGNLPQPLTNSMTLSTNNLVTVSEKTNATVAITTANGFLKGTFWHPALKKSVPFKGVLLQEQQAACGYFLGTNQSGAFWLEAK